MNAVNEFYHCLEYFLEINGGLLEHLLNDNKGPFCLV